jgi:hypothetical protein
MAHKQDMEKPNNRGGAEGLQPSTPVRLDNDEEDADWILQLDEIMIPMRDRMAAMDADDPGSPRRIALEAHRDDLRWREAHPGESVRVRKGVAGELPGPDGQDGSLDLVETTFLPGGFTSCRALTAEERANHLRPSSD